MTILGLIGVHLWINHPNPSLKRGAYWVQRHTGRRTAAGKLKPRFFAIAQNDKLFPLLTKEGILGEGGVYLLRFPGAGELLGFGHLLRVHVFGDVPEVFDGAFFMCAVFQLCRGEGVPHVRLHQILRYAFPLMVQGAE